MNKFIVFAFFALCATVAQGQLYPISPLSVLSSDIISQNGGASSSSAAAAAASSSSAANNNVLSQRNILPLAAPWTGLPLSTVGPLPINGYPWVGNPWVSPLGPYGAIGPVGPLGPLVL